MSEFEEGIRTDDGRVVWMCVRCEETAAEVAVLDPRGGVVRVHRLCMISGDRFLKELK